MDKINIKLYQACIAKKIRLQEIAKQAGIPNTRFSKILNGKLTARQDERQKLSRILHVAQRDLF